MHALSRQQSTILVVLTRLWGFNWPVMKLRATSHPPLTFRALSMRLGLPVLWPTSISVARPAVSSNGRTG